MGAKPNFAINNGAKPQITQYKKERGNEFPLNIEGEKLLLLPRYSCVQAKNKRVLVGFLLNPI